jgi:hypothetical protein
MLSRSVLSILLGGLSSCCRRTSPKLVGDTDREGWREVVQLSMLENREAVAVICNVVCRINMHL